TTESITSAFKNDKHLPLTINEDNCRSMVFEEKSGVSINNKPVVYRNVITASVTAAKTVTSSDALVTKEAGFSVSPNPAKNYIVLILQSRNNSERSVVRMTDLSGRTVMTKTIQS